MNNQFDKELQAILNDSFAGGAFHPIKELIKKNRPEEKNDEDCDCQMRERCGCKVQDHNQALKQWSENMGL